MYSLPCTLRQLEVFSSLCVTRSFRRSAENLGVSQASVSSQMKVMEEQLGVTLLARSPGKRPSLTAEGLAFLEDLRIFEAAGRALAAHRRSAPILSSPIRFRLLVGQGLWDNFLRPKLDHFLVEHPNITLDFDAQPPEDRIARALDEGQYDFILLHRRAGAPLERQMRSMALLRGGIYGHRNFADKSATPLDAEAVSQLPFILPRPGSVQEREALRGLERHGIRPRHVVCHSQYYDVIAAMLDRGVAVSSFADALIPPAMRETIILLYPLEDWRLVWFRKDHDDDPQRNAVEAFLLSSVLKDPHYPATEIYDADYARGATPAD
ncbi:MAG TPA: LysR family transcriptional regulator [Sphingobium sp.]|nr:LysR family transcriptional regulator [Sphingobium sp.]